MSALLTELIHMLIHRVGTNNFIDEADAVTQGLVSSYVQEAIDNAIIEALTDYINTNNISLSELPENWRHSLIEILK